MNVCKSVHTFRHSHANVVWGFDGKRIMIEKFHLNKGWLFLSFDYVSSNELSGRKKIGIQQFYENSPAGQEESVAVW